MKSDIHKDIDDLFAKIRLKLLDIRETDPETVQELKSLLTQLEDWVESLRMDSIRLSEIRDSSRRKKQHKK